MIDIVVHSLQVHWLLYLIGALMGLAVQRLALAVWIKDYAGRDHCELVIAVLVAALAVAVK